MDPAIISHRANLWLVIVLQPFPAPVPGKELAWGERPRTALQITRTSLFLLNPIQLQMEYKLLHLRTDLRTISSPEGLLFPVFSSTRRVFKTPACQDHQQLQILKCQTNLGVVSLLLKHELYNSVILVAVKLVIKTPKSLLCCLLLSRKFNGTDVSPSELCHFSTKSNLSSTEKETLPTSSRFLAAMAISQRPCATCNREHLQNPTCSVKTESVTEVRPSAKSHKQILWSCP